jgi:uncharacterized membrane-anchored protein
MKMSFNFKIWLAISLQIFIVIFLLGFYQYQLVKGEKILLKLAPPRDPLSLLQGHYLALNYEISQLEVGKYYGPSDFEVGETIYVSLEKKDNYYQAHIVSRFKPKEGPFIKGKVISNYQGNLNIQYGIESYFIPERKAKEIEKEFRKLLREPKDIFVQISLNKFGNALIRKIIINGKEIDFSKIRESQELGPKAKARDERRKADIREIFTAMELYYSDHQKYPQSKTMPPNIGNYFQVPKDPLGNSYNWLDNTQETKTNCNDQHFCVWAKLEGGGYFVASEENIKELASQPTHCPCLREIKSLTCQDSDEGKNYEVKGVCTDVSGTYTDSCSEDFALKEYYCNENNQCVIDGDLKFGIVCPQGGSCQEGACLPKPFITLLSPNSKEEWISGNTYDIIWNSKGIDKIDIFLVDYSATPKSQKIAQGVSASLGKYSWTIPSNFGCSTQSPCFNFKIEIGTEKIKDQSDDYFSIVKPYIKILSPNGGEVCYLNEPKSCKIEWNFSLPKINKFDIYLEDWEGVPETRDAPISFLITRLIWKEKTNSGSFTFYLALPKSTQRKIKSGKYYKIKIFDADNPSIYDRSDNYFTILIF